MFFYKLNFINELDEYQVKMPGLENKNSRRFDMLIFLVFVVLGCGLYYVPLHSSAFYFDDHITIENNEAIRRSDLPTLFKAFNTRFLVGVSFALNYKWCYLNAAGYRLINLLIHCLNAFLVYVLVKSILASSLWRKPKFSYPLEWPALFASLLFLCHPIHTETVNFVTQRFVLMGTFFYMLTLVLYIQYRSQAKKRYLIASVGSALAAMLCKEFVVTLPLMLAVYDFYFPHSTNESLWMRCRPLLPFFVIVLIVPILLLKTPQGTIGVANIANSVLTKDTLTQKITNHIDITRARASIGRRQYFLTELNVVCTYLRLLFVPIHQNLDYDYPLAHGIDKKTIGCGILLLGLVILAIVFFHSNRIISFSILWFFIALSVESSIIPIGDVIAEYRLYLPSVGFVLGLSSWLYGRKVDLRKLNVIAVILLIGCSMLTIQRNKVWGDEFALWNDTVAKSPHKARPYNNRGNAYAAQGNVSHALSDFNMAITINPKYEDAYYDRGVLYDSEGMETQALADFSRTIDLYPQYLKAYIGRGIAYAKLGYFNQALFSLNKAIEINHKDPEIYLDRATVEFQEGDMDQAMIDLDKATEINPYYAKAYFNRAIIYAQEGDLARSITYYNKTIDVDHLFYEAYYGRGVIYAKQGNITQAMSDYSRTIEINPKDEDAYINRGIIYAQQGNRTQAIMDLTRAIELNPNSGEAYDNRAATYYQFKEYDKAWADIRHARKSGFPINPYLINALKKVTGKNQ